MARALALRPALPHPDLVEWARVAVVVSCALALMLAGRALPF